MDSCQGEIVVGNRFHDLIESGECLVPGETICDPRDEQAHIARYKWAQHFCENVVVLDAACGVGYGTKLLAEVAESVHGIDKSADAIQYAWEYHAVPNNGFEERSVYAISRIKAAFGVIVSFETIEHLSKPERFVREVHKTLSVGGLFIVSAPEFGGWKSQWHFWDFTKEALRDVLSMEFDMSRARYFLQNLGDTIVEDSEQRHDFPTHIYVCVK